MYVRVHVCKCSDCRLSTFNLLSDTLLAWLIKSPLPAGGFGSATRKTLSLTQTQSVTGAGHSAPHKRKSAFVSVRCTFLLVLAPPALNHGPSFQRVQSECSTVEAFRVFSGEETSLKYNVGFHQHDLKGNLQHLLVARQQTAPQQCPGSQVRS